MHSNPVFQSHSVPLLPEPAASLALRALKSVFTLVPSLAINIAGLNANPYSQYALTSVTAADREHL